MPELASSTATRYAMNGDVRIAFEDLGGAGGDPLLLVMGLGASRFWWPGLHHGADAVTSTWLASICATGASPLT